MRDPGIAGLRSIRVVWCVKTSIYLSIYRRFILVSDYVRMEVTLVGASWDVVAGDRDGCIWQE